MIFKSHSTDVRSTYQHWVKSRTAVASVSVQVYFSLTLLCNKHKNTYGTTFLILILVCLFVWLSVWGFSSHSRIFHPYGNVTITDGGIQNLTYARYFWPLSSEGSLACETYCDTGHPFIIITDKNKRILAIYAAGIRTPNLPLAGRRLLPTAPPLRPFSLCTLTVIIIK